MVKRPLLWLFLAFIPGIACSKYICFKFQIIPIFLITVLVSVFFYFFLKYHFKNFSSQDKCILILPLFLLLGFFIGMYHLNDISFFFHEADIQMKERETENVTVRGEAVCVMDKENIQEIYLKDAFVFFQGGKQFYVGKIVLKKKGFSNISLGDVINAKGEMSLCERARNPGNYDEKSYYQAQNINYKIQNSSILQIEPAKNIIYISLEKIKKRISEIYHEVLEPSDCGIIQAMILGDKSELDTELKSLYQKSGIAHLLAISGLHVALISLLLFRLLKKTGLHHNLVSVLSMVFIYLYGLMTGFHVSTNRAVVMTALSLSGCLAGRTYDSLSGLALSGFVILLQEPFQLFQCGFLLSFLAVAGIVWFYPICFKLAESSFQNLEKRIQEKKKMEWGNLSVWCYQLGKSMGRGLLSSFAIQLVLLPVLMWFYYEIPVLAPFLNVFILPLATLLIILALLIIPLGMVFLPAGTFLAGGVHYILLFYQFLCQLSQKISFSILITGRPEWWQVIVFYMLLFLFGALAKRIPGKYLASFLLGASLILFFQMPVNGMEVTFLDVGQGDCIYMETKSGLHMLMDGGSTDIHSVGKYRIQPFLLKKGVKKLDYCFLSHMDADHINGIQELLEASSEPGCVKISCIVLPDTSYEDEMLVTLASQAQEKGTRVLFLEKGKRMKNGSLGIYCLHPYFSFPAQSANDYSMVLEVSYEGFSMILAGDVGEEGEESMLSSGLLHFASYDVLKVAHHGSRNNSPEEWVNRIRPKLAVISSGYENQYGHPHKETLERLQAAGARVLQTVSGGAITVKYAKGKIKGRSYLEE